MSLDYSKQKLLVVGAGIGQMPLIHKAMAKGIHVTVVTVKGDYPAIEVADDCWFIDIYDRDAIVEKAREEGITAVISDQNDLMMPTVAYIAEKLGLPGNRFDQVMSYCDKNTYRDNCDKLGNPVPKHIAVFDENMDLGSIEFPLPWIVKPSDSQSSIGVKRVDDLESAKEAIRFALAKSKTHSAIVEEFFKGKEIVCEGFIVDGKYHLLSFADRKYFDRDDVLIPCQTLFPSNITKTLLDQVVSCEEKMADYIHPSFAIVHSEYLINEETDEIRVVESALRGGGVYISSHLIPLATGLDINELVLSLALGEDVDHEAFFASKQQKASGYVCFYLPEGTITKISGVEEVTALPYVKMVALVNIKVGLETEPMTFKGSRKGPLLVCGEDREDLEKKILQIQDMLKIEVTAPDGSIKGIIWQ
ncbi:MAG: ATP-grasp domain-containing protein [Clostridiales bacterium]|nr:ATP-grasp domain-containing protein [Clostridiales bacterium]